MCDIKMNIEFRFENMQSINDRPYRYGKYRFLVPMQVFCKNIHNRKRTCNCKSF